MGDPMRTLLIDGGIAFRFAIAAEHGVEFDGVYTLTADLPLACTNMDSYIENLINRLDADRVVVALSEQPIFRAAIYPAYKANREVERDPMILRGLQQHLRDTWEVKSKPTLEADDVLGILLTNPKLYAGTEKVLVSIDKDMQTIPGLHCNPTDIKVSKEGEVTAPITEITPEEADRAHLMQTLVGDRVDNYPGCPGLGPKRAEKLLDEDCSWEAVVAAFKKAGVSPEDALVQAQVARICRHEDFDYAAQRPIPWTPST